MNDNEELWVLNREPYIPASLSEIYDYLAGTLGGAPTFVDDAGFYPDQNIDTEFVTLVSAFDKVRGKLGEDRHAKLIELAAQAKALFAADPNNDNGKTGQGYKVLHEIEGIVQDARKHRVKAKLKDDEGEVTGD